MPNADYFRELTFSFNVHIIHTVQVLQDGCFLIRHEQEHDEVGFNLKIGKSASASQTADRVFNRCHLKRKSRISVGLPICVRFVW